MQNYFENFDSPEAAIWEPESVKLIEGGVLLDVTTSDFKTTTQRVKKGSPLYVNYSTRKAVLVKTAKVYANVGSTGVSIKVYKNHELNVGEYLAKTVGGTAYAISSITTTNADYDTVVVGTTLGALTAGDILFESSATGASAAAEKYTVNSLLAEEVDITLDNRHIGVVVGAMNVHENRLPFGLTTVQKTALTARFHFI
jgi:hypothetical protein